MSSAGCRLARMGPLPWAFAYLPKQLMRRRRLLYLVAALATAYIAVCVFAGTLVADAALHPIRKPVPREEQVKGQQLALRMQAGFN